jgi:BirA family biotin operon repressor/biotin-[acetyl-CoA-carboxylase] ligase
MLDITFIKESLLNKTFVSWVYYFDELASTNDFAKKINGHDNVLIISEYQYSGKGRYGRNWKSEKGSNLTFTIKKKFGVSPEQNSYLNFYFTYFLYKALQRFLNENFPKLKTDSLEIKWPNDILFDSKKICGILIETSKSNSLIVGVGLNVNQQSFDDDLRAA